MADAVTYHDLIARNKRNSALLVAAFLLLTNATVASMAVALFGGGAQFSLGIVLVTAGMTSLVAAFAYYGGAETILKMSSARRVTKNDDAELCNVVEEMAIAAGLPSPAVYLIPDTALNAFATGRDPEDARIVLTSGLRSALSRDELQSVVAHEMSHIRYNDTRLSMLLTVLVGLVVLVSDAYLRGARWGMLGGMRGVRRKSDGGSAGAALLVVSLVLAAVSPVLVRLIQMAASREREYLADAGAVELTRNPAAMVSALRKLDGDREVLEVANRATAHLYIVPPIKGWEERATGLFATHPQLANRIERIRSLSA